MYLMYVDESGDTGLTGSPYFVLTGLVVHESSWNNCHQGLVAFRRQIRQQYGVRLREEIHTSIFLHRPGSLVRIPKQNRLAILRHLVDTVELLPNVSLLNVVVDKSTKSAGYDVFHMAWTTLMQRFENTMLANNFRANAPNAHGLIIPDQTNAQQLTKRLRAMRYYNPVPNQAQYGSGYRNLTFTRVIEDPFFRDSRHSYFIQACDCISWMLTQEQNPCKYIQQKTGRGYFHRLQNCLCTVASRNDPRGIVRL